jgi:hypothetical protein
VENRALWSEQGNPLPFADAPLSLSPNETGGASIRGVPGFPPNPLSPPLSLSSFLHTLSSTPTTPLRTRKSIAQPLVWDVCKSFDQQGDLPFLFGEVPSASFH